MKTYGFANLDTSLVDYFEPVLESDPCRERFYMPANLIAAQHWVLRCKRLAQRAIAKAMQP